MSTYFSKVIKAGDKLREFNFRQTYLNDNSRYSVDVPDDKGARIMFSIYRNADAEWKVAAQLMPMWVHNAEEELARAIEENNESHVTKKER
jgi:uridine kinase